MNKFNTEFNTDEHVEELKRLISISNIELHELTTRIGKWKIADGLRPLGAYVRNADRMVEEIDEMEAEVMVYNCGK
jgi:hypothetical protein